MSKLIDSPSSFINLTDDEIREKLLDPKYNSANLRELVRRCIIDINISKEEASRYKKMHDFVANKLNKMLMNIQKEMDAFLEGE